MPEQDTGPGFAGQPAADPVAARLAGIRERNERWIAAALLTEASVRDSPSGNVRLLVAAVEAALKGHYKVTLYTVAIAEYDTSGRIRCGHTDAEMDNDRHALAGDSGDVLCLAKPEADVCAECWDSSGEQAEWPCPTVRAITRELLGEGSTGD